MRAALLLALVACGSSTSAPPLQGSATTPPPPTTAAPSIRWATGTFDRAGFPAVSNDGKLVVFSTSENDAGRGNVNLTLESRTRADIGDQKIKVLTVAEYERMVNDDGPVPALAQRITAANSWLTDLHRRVDLRPLPALVVDATDAWTQHAAKLGDIALDWQNDHLSITKAGASLISRDTPVTWHAHDRDQCSNPAKLGNAWVDAERKVALVEVVYNGNDSCWEPSPQLHVVAW
ncbi:MAG: hypothetical protein ABI175_18935 [Polyangiales bacterium]